MSKQPLVSIALATFNGERYLAKQLDSLIDQDYPNLEIVISDDCSTDKTWEIIELYARKDDRIRLLPRSVNFGYVKNFIRVFFECKGDLIAPSDQDDRWHPQKISRLVAALGNASLAYCDSNFIDKNDGNLGKRLSDTVRMIVGSDPRNFLFSTSVCGHAMLFRRSLLFATDKLDSAPYIDWMIAFLAARDGEIVFIKEALVDWRHHDESSTHHVRYTTKDSRRKLIKTDEGIISAFAEIPGPHQQLAIEAKQKFLTWKNSYIHLPMFFFVLKHSKTTHIGHPAKIPALKYLAGQKLKQLIRPNYY